MALTELENMIGVLLLARKLWLLVGKYTQFVITEQHL